MTKKEKIAALMSKVDEMSEKIEKLEKRILLLELSLKAIEEYNTELSEQYKQVFKLAENTPEETKKGESEKMKYMKDVQSMFSFE